MTSSFIIDPAVFIITGRRRGGKTSFLIDLIEKLKGSKLSLDGILAIASSGEEIPDSYSLSHIKTGKSIPLCDRNPVKDWIKAGPFHFNPVALEMGNRIFTCPEIGNNDLIFIDEIGRFELEGKIWATSVSLLLRNAPCPLVLSVRETFTDQVIEHWNLEVSEIFDIHKTTPYKASLAIIKRIKINKP